ncbi:hypothetical protein BDZ89DRAFT_344932 [Hymenopellis radicata]|nr:hypothetical protein BDZ89DRAFT_344932 [Hymenopellis radicata]
MTSEQYPRSILTRTSSTSTQRHAPSIMASRATRQRSGSCSKSVKFVEIPTVHYANIDWDWVIPDEEESDVDTESEPEEEDEGSFPPSGLGKMLGFAEQAQHNKSVDTLDSVRTTGSSSGEKPARSKSWLASSATHRHRLGNERPKRHHRQKSDRLFLVLSRLDVADTAIA